MSSPPTTSQIVIVGAGAFGLSTAFHLLGRGYTNVTILDRAKQLPAVDAASTDINKIVRSCYTDIFYTRLAREAMDAWKLPMWQGTYHECGVINVGSDGTDETWMENDRKIGAPIQELADAKAIRAKLSASLNSPTTPSSTPSDLNLDSNTHRIGTFTGCTGYFNPEGGWVEATRAMEILLSSVKAMGGRVVEDQEVVDIVKDGCGKTTGVRCKNGTHFKGDKIVLTIGSWTASTFPDLEIDSKCLATGQSVAMIQLTMEERERYRRAYVYLDFDHRLYVFPPTESGILKFAIHSAGHTHSISAPRIGDDTNQVSTRKISIPRTITSHPESGDGLRVPRSALFTLRKHLRKLYPELAEKPLTGTRLCWYTDSPDGDWVIGPFPGDPALFLATSGSGHAFKFLPNIGRLIADALEGKLDAETAARFAVDRDVAGAKNGERASVVTQELDVGELCGPEE